MPFFRRGIPIETGNGKGIAAEGNMGGCGRVCGAAFVILRPSACGGGAAGGSLRLFFGRIWIYHGFCGAGGFSAGGFRYRGIPAFYGRKAVFCPGRRAH